jgi:hypothetical protein
METNHTDESPNIQKDLPYSTTILILGILSITLSWSWGIPGLISGLLAIKLFRRSEWIYNQNPEQYNPAHFLNLKAGKLCSMVGLGLSGIVIFLLVVKWIIQAIS